MPPQAHHGMSKQPSGAFHQNIFRCPLPSNKSSCCQHRGNQPYDTRQICLYIISPMLGMTSSHGQQFVCAYLGIGHCYHLPNGKSILIWDCLHVSTLWNLLYSLRAHQQCQKDCGFLEMYGMGMFVSFTLSSSRLTLQLTVTFPINH
jgi:hypothetical protein